MVKMQYYGWQFIINGWNFIIYGGSIFFIFGGNNELFGLRSKFNCGNFLVFDQWCENAAL